MCKYLKTPKGPQFLLFELQGFVSGFSLTSKNYFIILKKKKSIKQFQIIAAGGPVFWDLKKMIHMGKRDTNSHRVGHWAIQTHSQRQTLFEMKLLGRKNSC